ncbi:hypothetical protein FAZ95_32475 [Trinickia violacea]|uniref:Uncharacterized protein n=1 Tax=Trinickia violacea TaxID=2571746 RepID=A0A4V1EIG9_9BURK|nr:hypothetical protein [Trinickia violacea]QCP53730.1 hypothetical protein FAZ95_32475 [Trinickia violacea]
MIGIVLRHGCSRGKSRNTTLPTAVASQMPTWHHFLPAAARTHGDAAGALSYHLEIKKFAIASGLTARHVSQAAARSDRTMA